MRSVRGFACERSMTRGEKEVPDVTEGKLVAAVGIALSFVAIWPKAIFDFNWSEDGTALAWLLILTILAMGAIIGSIALRSPGLTLTAAALSLLIWGFYGWWVAVSTEGLGPGAWLGFAGGMFASIGAIAAYSRETVLGPAGQSPAAPAATAGPVRLLALAVAAVGLALSFIAIWADFVEGRSYWNINGKSLGIVLLLLCLVAVPLLAVSAASIVATPRSVAVSRALGLGGIGAVAVGMLLAGFLFFTVVLSAFNGFDDLKSGAWLGFVGGILVAAGTAFAFLSRGSVSSPAAPARASG